MAVSTVRTWQRARCPGCGQNFPSWAAGFACERCDSSSILIEATDYGIACHIDGRIFERALTPEDIAELEQALAGGA